MRSALVLASLLAACGPPLDKQGKPITVGRLRLRTFPAGAKVWIDDALKVESTPATLILEAGRYRMRLQLEGAEALEETLVIGAGEVRELDLDLPRPPDAAVSVLSDELGAKVSVNGYTRGTTPLLRAITKPGPIDLTILTVDGRARSLRRTLRIGEHLLLEVFFDELACEPPPPPPPPKPPMSTPPPSGTLTLGLEPPGEVFDEEDRSLGRTPIERLKLEPGPHRLLLRAGKRERWVEVEIEDGKASIYRFRLLAEDEH